MSFRKTLASLAAAGTLTAAAVTAPMAGAQEADASADLFRQSAEPIAEGSFDLYQSLYDNPVTAPIGLAVGLSSMTFHFLIYCPIAQAVGLEDPGMGRCTI